MGSMESRSTRAIPAVRHFGQSRPRRWIFASAGVVLAVCSKNDESTARLPFARIPAWCLKEDDITVFMVNWDDKATNIERIAQRLDLGLDSIVLLDDNPVERALVREALPQVAVPELGMTPRCMSGRFFAAGYFESVAFTPEDLARSELYKSQRRPLEAARDIPQSR